MSLRGFIRRLFGRIQPTPRIEPPKPKLPQERLTRAEMYEVAYINQKWAKDSLGWYMARIRAGEYKYRRVADKTGVPWQVVAVIHALECSGDFKKHLHNGDPLSKKTVRAPEGRPLADTWDWESSAVDAIRYDRLDQKNWKDMGTALRNIEYYNGKGYEYRNMPSPYLWGGTQFHSKGKFVRDGKFDPEAHTRQIGAAILLKEAGF